MRVIYEAVVHLFEGGDQSIGYFSTKESAEEWIKYTEEDWADGPNVEGTSVIEHEVQE